MLSVHELLPITLRPPAHAMLIAEEAEEEKTKVQRQKAANITKGVCKDHEGIGLKTRLSSIVLLESLIKIQMDSAVL
jgi:hypothetical protein